MMGNNNDIVDLYGIPRTKQVEMCCGVTPSLVAYPPGRTSVYCSECDRISIPAANEDEAVEHWNEWRGK